MEYIYIDEKGPQNSFKKTNPFDKENKIAYGNDNMHVFVANVVRIPEYILKNLEEEYQIIEKEYLKTRKFKEGSELKGSMILKDNFEHGIYSLKKNEISFYSQFFKLLNDNNIDNLLFSISKMSLIIDSRLNDWILYCGEHLHISAVLLKYTLTKYASIEASESVIEALFDKASTNVNQVLQTIKEDFENIINQNIDNPRMQLQINSYKEIISLINFTKNMENIEPTINAKFNWEKVSFKMDLWLLEYNHINNSDQKNIDLILDEGIPTAPFEQFNFNSIRQNAKSEEHVGLRISDILVTITGSYISKLTSDTHYNFDQPTKTKYVSPIYFNLTKSKFELLKQMNKFFFKENKTYGFGVDTYFDQGLLFESFLTYINEYNTFDSYNKIDLTKHVQLHWEKLAFMMQEKYTLASYSESKTIEVYGSLKKAIQEGIAHPL